MQNPRRNLIGAFVVVILASVCSLAGGTNGPHLYADERVAARSTSSYEIEFDKGGADLRLMFYGTGCVITPAIFDEQGRAVEVSKTVDEDDEGCVSIVRWQVAQPATYVVKVVNDSDAEVEYAMSNN
jgi:hypothetical protein